MPSNPSTRTVLPSAARTALVPATDLGVSVFGEQNLEVVIVATAKGTAPSVTPTIRDASGNAVLVGAAITTAAPTTVILRYGKDAPNVANLSAQGIVHAGMTIEFAVGNADSLTYSVIARSA